MPEKKVKHVRAGEYYDGMKILLVEPQGGLTRSKYRLELEGRYVLTADGESSIWVDEVLPEPIDDWANALKGADE